LLDKDKSVTVHHANIKLLATEFYKVRNGLSVGNISNLFEKSNNPYNTRSNAEFLLPQVRTELHGNSSLRYLCPLIWNIVPQEIKNSKSLAVFKNLIKNWKPINCPCRLRKLYVQGVGFTNISQ